MADVLRIGAAVATPLSLLGLIAALSYYFYSRQLKFEEKKLEALPPEERARAVDQRLSRYGIDGSNITREDKTRLIFDEMEKRYRLAKLYSIIFAVVFVVCFGLASFAFIYATRPSDQHPQGIKELQDQFQALKAREETSNATLGLLIAKVLDGKASPSTPAVQQSFDEMKLQVETLKEGQKVSNAALEASIANVQGSDRSRPTPELTRLLVDWNRNINPSDTTVQAILLDPALSEQEKHSYVIMSIMKGLDRQIEEQVALVKSIQGSPSSDVETMKLKRLIDKRSEMYDTLRQIIDNYNDTAKSIIMSLGK